MKQKIIIIEKDQKLIESMSILLKLLYFDPIVFHNWNYKIKTLSRDLLAAVFVNIDNLTIKPEDINKSLSKQPGEKDHKIPIIYLCRSRHGTTYKTFKPLPHAAELIKPFSIEELFSVLRSNVKISPIKGDINVMEDELCEVETFKKAFDEWLSQLEILTEQ